MVRKKKVQITGSPFPCSLRTYLMSCKIQLAYNEQQKLKIK